MSKVKLDLKGKDFADLLAFAKAHSAAMVDNPNYPTPVPSVAVFDGASANYGSEAG